MFEICSNHVQNEIINLVLLFFFFDSFEDFAYYSNIWLWKWFCLSVNVTVFVILKISSSTRCGRHVGGHKLILWH